MNGLERRLARVEKQTDPGKTITIIDCWLEEETEEEAKRRYFAEHPEYRDDGIIIMWVWSESDPAKRRAMQQRMLERTRT